MIEYRRIEADIVRVAGHDPRRFHPVRAHHLDGFRPDLVLEGVRGLIAVWERMSELVAPKVAEAVKEEQEDEDCYDDFIRAELHVNLNLTRCQAALTPSLQVIFLPSSKGLLL